MKKNKDRGASLIYVLTVLSVITVFSVNFIYFVKERNIIASVKGSSENSVSKKFLQEMETRNSERIYNKGVTVSGFPLSLSSREDYFHSGTRTGANGDLQIVPLLYLSGGEKGIGNFYIKEIQDGSGNILNIPLAENTVYKNLEITFEKEVLGEKLHFQEKVSINRVDAMTVAVNIESSKFLE